MMLRSYTVFLIYITVVSAVSWGDLLNVGSSGSGGSSGDGGYGYNAGPPCNDCSCMACDPGQECYMEPGSTFAKPICHLKCGPNEALSMCEDTCVTKDKPIQRLCPNENICACKEGYVRDKQTRQCIPSGQCSSTTTHKPTGSTTWLTGSTGTRTTETGTSGTPGTPGNPTTSRAPGTTTTARTSGRPTTPGTPENPTIPRAPTTARTPGTPGTPTTSGTHGNPTTAHTPGTPGTTTKARAPGTPGTPTTARSPETPGTTTKARTSGTPTTARTSGTPGTTTTARTPGTPTTSGTRGNPTTPRTPTTARTPETAGTTTKARTPGTPGTSTTARTSGTLGTTTAAGTPGTTTKARTPGTPTTARNARTSETPTTATPTCCENEMLKRCSGCEATCAFPDGRPNCVPNCQQAKCECKPGFVRCPISGRCICASLCPKNSCPPNEDWNSCPTCEATCTNLNPICPMVCKTPACQCCKGYVRCPISGRCVTPASCPKINPLTHPKVRVAAQIMPRMVQVQQPVSQKQPAALKKSIPKFVVQRQAPVG